PANRPIRRCSPCKGLAIPCGLRLALVDWPGSERASNGEAIHQCKAVAGIVLHRVGNSQPQGAEQYITFMVAGVLAVSD
ncbi:MAG: hypothetical protein WBM63_14190, partial [Sedimenticolaceae bacterium]